MSKTYQNLIRDPEVSLGIEHLLVGIYGSAAWDSPARIANVDSPPTGFVHLGMVVDDAMTLTLGRESFDLRAGIPGVLQYQRIIALSGRMEGMLRSLDPHKMRYAFGNTDARNSFTGTSTIASVTSRSVITLEGSIGLAVGQWVMTAASSTALVTGTNWSKVSSVSGADVVVDPVFASTPSADDHAATLDYMKNVLGTAQIENYIVLGVTDFVDGIQVVHKLPKVTSVGEWTQGFQPGEEGRIPIAFEMHGVSNSDYVANQLIVGEIFTFPPEA